MDDIRSEGDNLERLVVTSKTEGKRPRGRSPLRPNLLYSRHYDSCCPTHCFNIETGWKLSFDEWLQVGVTTHKIDFLLMKAVCLGRYSFKYFRIT